MNQYKKRPRRKPSPLVKRTAFVLLLAILIISVAQCTKSCSKSKSTASEQSKTAVKTVNTEQNADDVLSGGQLLRYAQRTDETKSLKVDSDYGILINLDTMSVVADKKGDDRIYPASMTKVMTLIVAVENLKDLNETFTFTNELIDPLVNEEASRAGFDPDETVPVTDLLYGTVLPSGADATSALAIVVAGGEREFVKLMNKKANEMGLMNTHFMNASGLHDEYHYSTCHEMALILNYAMQNELCAKILSAVQYTTTKTPQHPDGIELYSTMFSRMYGNEAVGVTIKAGKTGYTNEGGNCLVSYAIKDSDGTRYILATAHASGQWKPTYDAIHAYAKYVGTGEENIQPEGTQDPGTVYY